MADDKAPDDPERPKGSGTGGRVIRAALQVAGGIIPLAGGFISAAAGAWGEHEQERVNAFVNEAIGLLRDDLREKQETIAEVVARLDLNDRKIDERVKSADYQKLLRKALRNWAGAESGRKREFIRNILSNAAAASLTSDDVVDMFLTWLHTFSELHFTVIGDVYQHPGTTRGEIWRRIGSGPTREDSAEADLYRLLFRDLSTGGIVRQHRETDYAGRFLAKKSMAPRRAAGLGPAPMKSSFDDEDQYELTSLGQQFVHYAMTDLPLKLTFTPAKENTENAPD